MENRSSERTNAKDCRRDMRDACKNAVVSPSLLLILTLPLTCVRSVWSRWDAETTSLSYVVCTPLVMVTACMSHLRAEAWLASMPACGSKPRHNHPDPGLPSRYRSYTICRQSTIVIFWMTSTLELMATGYTNELYSSSSSNITEIIEKQTRHMNVAHPTVSLYLPRLSQHLYPSHQLPIRSTALGDKNRIQS